MDMRKCRSIMNRSFLSPGITKIFKVTGQKTTTKTKNGRHEKIILIIIIILTSLPRRHRGVDTQQATSNFEKCLFENFETKSAALQQH